MFYTLHRALKLAFFCALIFVGYEIYLHRQVFEPALIWYDVWDNGGFNAPPLPAMRGHVEKVLSSQTFTFRGTNATRYNVRLTGLREPSQNPTLDMLERERKRKQALAELIENKDIRLDLNYENLNNLGGIAYLGVTNINACLVQRRLAFTDKDLVKTFPQDVQYQMLWSKRHRVDAK
jgi:hypothetical protein